MKRNKEILEVAIQVFSKMGYRAASLQHIADELGVTRPALYYHIESKQELLIQIYDQVTDILFEGLQPILDSNASLEAKLRMIISNHIKVVIENRKLLNVFYAEKNELPTEKRTDIIKREREYGQSIEKLYIQGVQSNIFEPIDSGVFVNSILGMFNWMQYWYNPKGHLSIEEITTIIIKLIEGGVLLPDAIS